jgi:hypothetical protein
MVGIIAGQYHPWYHENQAAAKNHATGRKPQTLATEGNRIGQDRKGVGANGCEPREGANLDER